MANVTGYVSGLIPGKRYRMVITAITNSNDPIRLPSIEFVTPTAPDLISSYLPVKAILSNTRKRTFSIPTSPIGARADTFNITHWSAVDGQKSYRFFCNGSDFSKATKGKTIRVYGISDYADSHAYYDAFDYRVVEKTSSYIDTVVSPTVTFITGSGTDAVVDSRALTANDWCAGASGHNKHINAKEGSKASQRPSGWIRYYLDGQCLKTRNKQPNAATATVYTNRIDAGSRTTEITWSEYDITVSIPERFPLLRNIPGGVVDVPVFAYKNLTTNTWHNMDHSAFVAINNPIQYSNSEMMQLIYDYDGNGNARKDGVDKNKTSFNVNRAIYNETTGVVNYDNHSKEYYFTIARYKKVGSSWQGGWLQSEDSEPRVSDPAAIIWSGAAR
jgi:hypothetical protein